MRLSRKTTKSNDNRGQWKKRKYYSSDSSANTSACSAICDEHFAARQRSSRKEKRTKSPARSTDFQIRNENEISSPIPTTVYIPLSFSENSNSNQVEGQLAKWMTRGELLAIAERYNGLAVQYRAKYHSGQPVKDSAPLPGYSLKKYKALADKPKINEGDLVVQTRFMSANGKGGGLTHSFKNFRLPGNLRARHVSIYHSTRPNLVVPKELNACPLFVIDEGLSMRDRNIVKDFLLSGESGKSPSQTFPDLQIDGEVQAAIEEAEREEVVSGPDERLECGDSNEPTRSRASSSSICMSNTSASVLLSKSPAGSKSASSADCEHLSSPSVADKAAIMNVQVGAEESDSTSNSSREESLSDSSMDCVPFIPSNPRLDAKPKRSILRKRKLSTLPPHHTNLPEVTPIRPEEELHQPTRGNGDGDAARTNIALRSIHGKDEEGHSVNCSALPDEYELSVGCVENANVITPHIPSKRKANEAGREKIQDHLALSNSAHDTILHRKQRRITYGHRNRRVSKEKVSFLVTEDRQNFCFLEEAREDQNVDGIKWGRIFELPGNVITGKWTSEIMEYEAGRGHIEANVRISFRNEARSIPRIHADMNQDGFDTYTINACTNRLAQFLGQRVTDRKDPILYKKSPPTSLRSFTLAAFDGFSCSSDFMDRRSKVTEMILRGQQKTHDSKCLLPISTLCNKEARCEHDGACFKHYFGIDSNILIHVAREEISGLIVAVDVTSGPHSVATCDNMHLNKKNLSCHKKVLHQTDTSSPSSDHEEDLPNVSRIATSVCPTENTNSLRNAHSAQYDADAESRHSNQSLEMGRHFSKRRLLYDTILSEQSSLSLEHFHNTVTSKFSTGTPSSASLSLESITNASRSTRARSISQSVGASTVLRIASSRSRAVRVNPVGAMKTNRDSGDSIDSIDSSIESSIGEEDPSNAQNTFSKDSWVSEKDENEQSELRISNNSPIREPEMLFDLSKIASMNALRYTKQRKLDIEGTSTDGSIPRPQSPKPAQTKTELGGHDSDIHGDNNNIDVNLVYRPLISSHEDYVGASDHSHFMEEVSTQTRSCNILNDIFFGVQDDDEHERTLMPLSNSNFDFEAAHHNAPKTMQTFYNLLHEFLFRDGTYPEIEDDQSLYHEPFIPIQHMFFGGLFDAEEHQEFQSVDEGNDIDFSNAPLDSSAPSDRILSALMHIFHYGPADSVSIRKFDLFCKSQDQHNTLPLQDVFFGVHDDEGQYENQLTMWDISSLDKTKLSDDCDDGSAGVAEDIDNPWIFVSFSDIALFIISLVIR